MSKKWGKQDYISNNVVTDDDLLDTEKMISETVTNISKEDEKMENSTFTPVWNPNPQDFKNDEVNHPAHYADDQFECIDVMMATQGLDATQDFCILNAFKYLYRHRKKGGIEDLKKADWYLQYAIGLEEKRK